MCVYRAKELYGSGSVHLHCFVWVRVSPLFAIPFTSKLRDGGTLFYDIMFGWITYWNLYEGRSIYILNCNRTKKKNFGIQKKTSAHTLPAVCAEVFFRIEQAWYGFHLKKNIIFKMRCFLTSGDVFLSTKTTWACQ